MIKTLDKYSEQELNELKNGVIEVSAKAKNRTALGIVDAVFTLFPKITFKELKEILPDSINPESTKMYKNLWNPYFPDKLCGVLQPSTVLNDLEKFNKELLKNGFYFNAEGKKIEQTTELGNVHFTKPEERFKTSDNVEVVVASNWSDTSLQKLIDQVANFGIRVVEFNSTEKFKRGEYLLKVINPAFISKINAEPKTKPFYKKPFVTVPATLATVGIISWLSLARSCGNEAIDLTKDKIEETITDSIKSQTNTIISVNEGVHQEKMKEFEQKLSDNILFSKDSYVISEQAKSTLAQLVTYLTENKEISITIYGKASIEGTAEHNKKLALNRAKSIYDFLISKGIEPNRLKHERLENEATEVIDSDRHVEFKIN